MPTTVGKKLRSRKVQLACERRQNQYSEKEDRYSHKQHLLNNNDPNFTNLQTLELTKYNQVSSSNSFTEKDSRPIKSKPTDSTVYLKRNILAI
jgi:hypothetical protein